MKPITAELQLSKTSSNHSSHAYVGKHFSSPVTLVYVPRAKLKEPPKELKITIEEIKE